MKKIASCATALVAVVPATIGLGDKAQADRGWHHGWGGGIAAGIVGGIVRSHLYRPYYYAYGYPYYYANGYPYYNHGSPWYYRPYYYRYYGPYSYGYGYPYAYHGGGGRYWHRRW
jgi:hypothetical protein